MAAFVAGGGRCDASAAGRFGSNRSGSPSIFSRVTSVVSQLLFTQPATDSNVADEVDEVKGEEALSGDEGSANSPSHREPFSSHSVDWDDGDDVWQNPDNPSDWNGAADANTDFDAELAVALSKMEQQRAAAARLEERKNEQAAQRLQAEEAEKAPRCTICMEQEVILYCQTREHGYCSGCLEEHIRQLLNELLSSPTSAARGGVKLSCAACDGEWEWLELMDFLSSSEVKRLYDKVCVHMVIRSEPTIECAHCSSVITGDASRLTTTFTCRECRQRTCFKCDPPVKLSSSGPPSAHTTHHRANGPSAAAVSTDSCDRKICAALDAALILRCPITTCSLPLAKEMDPLFPLCNVLTCACDAKPRVCALCGAHLGGDGGPAHDSFAGGLTPHASLLEPPFVCTLNGKEEEAGRLRMVQQLKALLAACSESEKQLIAQHQLLEKRLEADHKQTWLAIRASLQLEQSAVTT